MTFFLSCVTINKTKNINLKYYVGETRHKITLKIPEGYKLIKIITGGEGEEHRYWYSDSSLIYLSDASSLISINEESVRNQEAADYRKNKSDSFLFKGVNTNGNYWTEIKNKGLLYGYFNVPPYKKHFYDSALKSLKYRF
jgi:hypothetical protein